MKPYCVYLTIYLGNKMPPFYIGSTSVDKINNGYHGSVSSKMWKETWWSEIKYNPHLFESKIICLHETRQEATDKEYKLQKQLNVVKNPLYINQAFANINGHFGRDVSGELNPMFGKERIITQETRKRMSESRKLVIFPTGVDHPNFGKKHKETTIDKIRISNLGKVRTPEHSRNISLGKRGKPTNSKGTIGMRYKWATNELINIRVSEHDPIPNGYRRGRNMKLNKGNYYNVT